MNCSPPNIPEKTFLRKHFFCAQQILHQKLVIKALENFRTGSTLTFLFFSKSVFGTTYGIVTRATTLFFSSDWAEIFTRGTFHNSPEVLLPVFNYHVSFRIHRVFRVKEQDLWKSYSYFSSKRETKQDFLKR